VSRGSTSPSTAIHSSLTITRRTGNSDFGYTIRGGTISTTIVRSPPTSSISAMMTMMMMMMMMMMMIRLIIRPYYHRPTANACGSSTNSDSSETYERPSGWKGTRS
jgi:hypothetical protein